jgi:hypothetical protein
MTAVPTQGAAPWADPKEGRFFKRIEIARNLLGEMVTVPLHVLTGYA